MPAAWVAFLLAAESYIAHYGGIDGAIMALRDGLDDAERAETAAFLKDAAGKDEAHCRAVTAIDSPVVAANAFRPEPCLAFYRQACRAFS